jgi:hypothetical protein
MVFAGDGMNALLSFNLRPWNDHGAQVAQQPA